MCVHKWCSLQCPGEGGLPGVLLESGFDGHKFWGSQHRGRGAPDCTWERWIPAWLLFSIHNIAPIHDDDKHYLPYLQSARSHTRHIPKLKLLFIFLPSQSHRPSDRCQIKKLRQRIIHLPRCRVNSQTQICPAPKWNMLLPSYILILIFFSLFLMKLEFLEGWNWMILLFVSLPYFIPAAQ